MNKFERVVVTGVGLTAPNGNSLAEFRKNLLDGRSGVRNTPVKYMGDLPAGLCNFDEFKYQNKKARRRGTRAGSISIWCGNEAMRDAGLDIAKLDRARIGVYLGITEHGNVESESEVCNLYEYGQNINFWSHHHNPRSIANNAAGELTLNMGIHGPHYTIGGACAAGNMGIIQGTQMLKLGDVDYAIAGGISESATSFGIFASFKAEGALASHQNPEKASRPFDKGRNGIVVAEGGCVYILERLPDALKRGAKIYAEIAGYAMNSDAYDYVTPDPVRQSECMNLAIKSAGITPGDIDIVNTHATATQQGDINECAAVVKVFGQNPGKTRFNNTKSFIGHTMGAAGALELTGNIPSFVDGIVHPTINIDDLDPECALPNLVINRPENVGNINFILNNSFGMLGVNSVLIVKKYSN